jgi:hypothetical protein
MLTVTIANRLVLPRARRRDPVLTIDRPVSRVVQSQRPALTEHPLAMFAPGDSITGRAVGFPPIRSTYAYATALRSASRRPPRPRCDERAQRGRAGAGPLTQRPTGSISAEQVAARIFAYSSPTLKGQT